MTLRLAPAFVLFTTLLIAGCQAPVVDQTGPLSIRSISVTKLTRVKTATDLAPAVQAAATGIVVGPGHAGPPADLSISINQVTYKDPVLALLVGSRNAMTTTVTVTGEGGTVLNTFETYTQLADAGLDGLVGAAIAIGQNRDNVDGRLANVYATQLKIRIYGPAGYKPKKPARVAADAVKAQAPEAAAPAVPTPTKRPGKKETPVS